MNYQIRQCGSFIPAIVLTAPKPPNIPTIQSMTKYINKWVYFWSVFGYEGWIYILRVGIEEDPETKELRPIVFGCHPGIAGNFSVFLDLILNYDTF
ncbi:hypothetical protein COK07_27430 [Bacillus thuringiensis]|uniref:hypothetical protein n=1 Tax=Bacillus thuringiensis TaxID=1428 RepID=UPI000BF85747|nr:hypothetical protein [Bacillus thuringiensis]PFP71472.1 hypothetical protein COK07_27430 [Bacillus thuringiensis]